MGNEEKCKALIRAFNKAAGGTHYKFNRSNLYWVEKALERFGGDDYALERAVRDEVKENDSLVRFFMNVMPKETPKQEPEETPFGTPETPDPGAQAPVPQAPKAVSEVDGLANLCAAVAQQALMAMADRGKMADIISSQVKAFIENEYGPLQKKVTYKFEDGREFHPDGVVHECFEKILGYCIMETPVYMYGPAGSGKGFIARQVAKALGLDFGVTSGVTDEFQLFGFTDANGHYIETPFYRCYVNGGVFFLDEMDSSNTTALEKLNGAIADGMCAFPAPAGVQPMHPNFRLVAAGNTLGDGADSNYTARDVLDAATLDRFAKVAVDYDQRVENALCTDTEALGFLRALRAGIVKCSITRAIISYRCMERISKSLAYGFKPEQILKESVITNLTKDDLNTLSQYVQGYGRWTEAYERVRKGA